ncbi:DUF4233 domain-containing protein [Lysinibacter sp. HNR]|uniref:DUF4233 domain-containing protein n=1 Tax=Lysinibacter sp. HNR TaxID=3031408 RepID=UPI002435F96C|nr:DUF4233 domain-containing protein [Lysinibacter sp. HNR]WGD36275.1 DUF4233 domain-containing protein [Lysinibacter sp. HNR]
MTQPEYPSGGNSETQGETAPSSPAARSVKRSLASIALGFQLLIIFLGGLTVFGLSAVEPRELGLYGGGVLCLIAIAAIALLRYPVGYWLGWFVQVALLLSGFLVPVMFIVGGMFAALWIYCIYMGNKLDERNRLI